MAVVLLFALVVGQVQLEDDFESGAISSPWVRGPINVPDASYGLVAGAGRALASTGLRFDDAHLGPSAGDVMALRAPADGGSSQYLRSWMRSTGTGGGFTMAMQINAANAATGYVFGAYFLPLQQAVIYECYDRIGTPYSAMGPVVPSGQFFLSELQLEGLGTSAGRCLAWHDGALVLDAGADFSGLVLRDVALGEPYAQTDFTGQLDFDDAYAGPTRRPFALRWAGPHSVPVGPCTHYKVDLMDSAELMGRTRTIQTPVAVTTSNPTVALYDAPACLSETSIFFMPANGGAADVYVRFPVAGVTTLKAVGGTFAFPGSYRVSAGVDGGVSDAGAADAGTPDAGLPDAGVPDAGTSDAGAPDGSVPDAGTSDAGLPDGSVPDGGAPDAGALDGGRPDASDADDPPSLRIGCGCQQPGASWAPWLLALVARRRARLATRRTTR